MSKLLYIQKQLTYIVNDKVMMLNAKIDKMNQLSKEIETQLSKQDQVYYLCMTTIEEAKGDLYMFNKQPLEAEKCFRNMLKTSKECFDLYPETEYRYGFSSYKMASYYSVMLGCNKIEEKSKELDEVGKKVFSLCDNLYKTAIQVTNEKSKAGDLLCNKLHASAMSELSLLYASIKNMKYAIKFGEDGVKVSKSIYEVFKTRDFLYILINRINRLATIYKLAKQEDKAIMCLQESISYAKERIKEDPVNLGIFCGKMYLALTDSYVMLKKIKEADETCEIAIEMIAQAHKDASYTLYEDVIKAYIRVGEHFENTHRDVISRSYYISAYEKAGIAYEETNKEVFKKISEDLSLKLRMN